MPGRTVIPISAHPQVGKISEAEWYVSRKGDAGIGGVAGGQRAKRFDAVGGFDRRMTRGFKLCTEQSAVCRLVVDDEKLHGD